MEPPKIMPPHYFFGFLVLMVGLDLVPVAEPLIASPWHWLGVVPVGLGVAIAVIAAGLFQKAGTDIRPLTESSALVTDGPFAFSRNPMYLSMTVALLGVAMLLNSGLPFLAIPVFVTILFYRFIRHEESLMAETFGEAYLTYKNQVRRWV
jgi:protein-S-isoprenylcysteine O-methyltransferase Ste14